MKVIKTILIVILVVLLVLTALLFSVYWFDLDVKLLKSMDAKAKAQK